MTETDLDKTAPSLPSKFKGIFRAISYRNYRLFFIGQGVSLIGTWMQQIALSWLVYHMTNSVFMLGVVSFTGQFPTFLFAPLAGVLSDRWDRHRILVLTQSLSMLQALILSVLVLTGVVTVWHVLLLSMGLGLVNALDIPARQSFVVHMIDNRNDLGNAIALNSAMFNAARLLGPAIAGILIAIVGEGICFLINGLSYIAVIAALLAMDVSYIKTPKNSSSVIGEIKEGLIYAYAFQPIRFILLLLALTSVMGVPYAVLMPAFTRDILHGGPHMLGFLMSAGGVGAVGGALYLASRRTVRSLGKLISLTTAIFGFGLIGFALSRSVPISLVLMIFIGFGIMVQVAASNTLLQTIVDDDKRGRIMSLFAVSFMGMAPFGSLLAGTLADLIGVTGTLMIGGGSCVLGALLYARKISLLREMMQPVYRQKGGINPF